MSTLVDISSFSALGPDAGANFAAARAFTSPFFDLSPTKETLTDTQASCTSYLVDAIVFERSSFGPMSLKRRPAKRYDPVRETVAVWMVQSGFHNGLAGDTTFRSRPGEIHLLDSACPLQVIASRRCISTVHLHYSAIGYDPSRHAAHLKLPIDAPKGALLAQCLTNAFAQLPTMTRATSSALGLDIAALVQSAFDLGTRPDPNQTSRARSLAAHAWLDARLDDMSLNAAALCKALGMSRSSVYRMFQADGGVQAYLRDKRLERAFYQLAAAPAKRGDVRKVAERWGFSDASHFNRVFRHRFQCAPSDVPPPTFPFISGYATEPRETTGLDNAVYDWLSEKY